MVRPMDATPPPQAQPPQPGSRTCPIHGVVIAPTGRCVICQRAESDGPGDPDGGRMALGVLVVLAALVGSVLVYRGVSRKPEAPVHTHEDEVVSPISSAPAVEARSDAADAAAAVARFQAANEEKQRAFEAAMRKVPVSVYTTRWCALCDSAKSWMKVKQITFTDVDVESAPEKLEALRKINPKLTVPTFTVDGEPFVGFGPGTIQGAIFRAAEKRVR